MKLLERLATNTLVQLIPIEYIAGLETIEITELLIPGEDEEETEALRARYFETFKTNAYGGNQKDYIQKTNAINGVGATKVTPIWNGGGTVLLTILNSEFSKASDTLIASVQNEIDPTSDGSGVGIAPIGHIVTVNTAEEVPVNISTSITFKDGYSLYGERKRNDLFPVIIYGLPWGPLLTISPTLNPLSTPALLLLLLSTLFAPTVIYLLV